MWGEGRQQQSALRKEDLGEVHAGAGSRLEPVWAGNQWVPGTLHMHRLEGAALQSMPGDSPLQHGARAGARLPGQKAVLKSHRTLASLILRIRLWVFFSQHVAQASRPLLTSLTHPGVPAAANPRVVPLCPGEPREVGL